MESLAAASSVANQYVTANNASDSLNSPPFAMRQHISVMNHIRTCGLTDVGFALNDNRHAMAALTACYSPNFIHDITQLDFDDEVKKFNDSGSYKNLSFVDWYAFRDYQEDGYLTINQYLRVPDSSSSSADVARRVKQLQLSLMHLIKIQSQRYQPSVALYRGQVIAESMLADIDEGVILSFPAFISAYEDQTAASDFCADVHVTDDVNVLFIIDKNEPLSGADIYDAVGHDEGMVLFLPNTKFVVKSKCNDEPNDVTIISLATCEIDPGEFESDLHQLIHSYHE